MIALKKPTLAQLREECAVRITEALYQARLRAQTHNEKFTIRDAHAIVLQHLNGWRPNPERMNGRDVLLDALVTLHGENLAEVPPAAFGEAVAAKREILAVSPDVTPEEIRSRHQQLSNRMRGVTIGPMGLAKNWAKAVVRTTAEVKVRT